MVSPGVAVTAGAAFVEGSRAETLVQPWALLIVLGVLFKEMVEHGLREFPNEACGLVAGKGGVPVKLRLDREECMVGTRVRHPFRVKLELGVQRTAA